MNIVCIYSLTTFSLKKELHGPADIPFGISYIATVLKQAGHNVKLAVFTPTSSIDKKVKTLIDDYQPGLFCLTAVSSQFPIIREVGEAIRRVAPSAFIILGGTHATLNPDETIAHDFVDGICIGEGEKAIIELARQLEAGVTPSDIANVWLKNRDSGQVEQNPIAPFSRDLDSLPFIDRDMWEPYISYKKGMIYTVLAGRGCPNKCTFCSNHALAQIAEGPYVRYRTPENIIAEIKQLIAGDENVKEVFLETETLGANLKYAYQLLEALAEFNSTLENKLKFATNLALSPKIMGNRDLLTAFKKANFDFFRIGLESGSEKIRREILNRPKYSNEELIEFCRLAREYDIKYALNILIGLPGETPEIFAETINCVRKCRPTLGVSVSIFFPYPGTKLFKLCQEQNIIRSKARTTFFERTISVLDLPGFSSRQIKKEYILFYYKVFKGYRPWWNIAGKTIQRLIDANPVVKRILKRTLLILQ